MGGGVNLSGAGGVKNKCGGGVYRMCVCVCAGRDGGKIDLLHPSRYYRKGGK
jgi:hypothetical protein